MSFGLPERSTSVENAIHDAEHAGIIFLAAASNEGGNTERPFPASCSRVICVHSTAHTGKPSESNSFAVEDTNNFSTLGVDISSVWDGDQVTLTGTSYATAVASAMAANVLAFTDRHAPEWYDVAHSHEGMVRIFKKLSLKKDGYDYVVPWKEGWWVRKNSSEGIAREICRTLG